MSILKKVRSYSVEIVMVLLLLVLGGVGYSIYKVHTLEEDISDVHDSIRWVSEYTSDLSNRPSNPASDELEDIQSTVDAIQDKLDSMDTDLYEVKINTR